MIGSVRVSARLTPDKSNARKHVLGNRAANKGIAVFSKVETLRLNTCQCFAIDWAEKRFDDCAFLLCLRKDKRVRMFHLSFV